MPISISPRWRPLGRLRNHRPALHRHQPHTDPQERLLAASRSNSSSAPASCASAMDWIKGVQVGPQVSQQQLETSAMYVKIAMMKAPSCSPVASVFRAKPMRMDISSLPPFLAESSRPCALPAKKSLARCSVCWSLTTFERALQIANDVDYGLSAAIYTRDVNQAYRAMRDLDTGIV